MKEGLVFIMLDAVADKINVKKVADVAGAAAEQGLSLSVKVLLAAGLLILGYAIAQLAAKAIRMRCERIRGFDQTLTPILAQSVSYGIIILSLIMVLSNFGIETTSIIAVLGAAGIAIGLALQGTLQNVAAGIMLLIIRPFRRGDYIEAGSAAGTVDETGLFMTRMRTVQGLFVAVPNSMIWSNIITNYSRLPKRRLDLQIGISYDADLDEARDLILRLLGDDERVHDDPAPLVVVQKLGESSVDLELRAWVDRGDYWDFNFDITRAIKLAFDDAGIGIPYPHRQIVLAPEVGAQFAPRVETPGEVIVRSKDDMPSRRKRSNKRKNTTDVHKNTGPSEDDSGAD